MNEKEISKKEFGLNQVIKTVLFGFLIWFIPAMVATLLWDVSKNEPIIDIIWFNAIMGAVWSCNFALFAFLYFKSITEDYSKFGLIAGIIWYVMNFLLDFFVVVVVLNLGITAFLPGVVVYINNLVLATMIGYLLHRKYQRSGVQAPQHRY